MRSVVGKQVRELFKSSFTTQGWSICDASMVPSGSLVFRKPHLVGSIFVLVLFDPMFDRFTLECAWSEDDSFHTEGFPRNPVAFPNHCVKADRLDGPHFRFRLASLWEPRLDPWWEVESLDGEHNSGRPAVFSGNTRECVASAIEALFEQGIPFLTGVLKERA